MGIHLTPYYTHSTVSGERKEVKEMKIGASYRKLVDGSVEVVLQVVDREDYPDGRIFNDYADYPDSENFTLGVATCDKIKVVVETPAEAVKWVQKQIEALRKHLNTWREVRVPEDETFSI